MLMLRATDPQIENGNVLPNLRRCWTLISRCRRSRAWKELTQNLLSVVFDCDGNLWFVTGGAAFIRSASSRASSIYCPFCRDAILNYEQTDLSKGCLCLRVDGEGESENGIATSMTGSDPHQQNCYLLRAEEGVDVVVHAYESAAKVSGVKAIRPRRRSCMGAAALTLTPNLVLFTDNQDIVNLLRSIMKTGEVVASARCWMTCLRAIR